MPATRAFAAALAATAALALAGCGGKDDSDATAFDAVRAWTWGEADADGNDANGRFELGDFVPLDEAPELPGFASFDGLKDSCLFNEETDALAPVAAAMTNEAPDAANLSAAIGYGPAGFFGTNNQPTELLLATSAAGGVDCERLDYDEPTWVPVWDDVAPGAATGRAYAYLVIRDYLVPDSPKGRPALRLHRAYLSVYAAPGGWITSVDGPDPAPPFTFPDSQKVDEAGFSLSGTRPPCGFARDGYGCVR